MIKQIAKEWLGYAKSDLKNARILFENKSYKDAIWYCHQAIEKSLKAIIVNQDNKVKKVHDLIELWTETGLSPNEFINKFLEELNPYYIPARYPEAAFKLKVRYTKRDTERILKISKEVFKWLNMALNRSA